MYSNFCLNLILYKLRQIENEEMTPDIILTCDIITVTSLCHRHVTRRQLGTWQIVLFFKKIQKIKNLKKNPRTDMW